MPTADIAKGQPARTMVIHLGERYTVPTWWAAESGIRTSPLAGDAAQAEILEAVETATRAAAALLAKWVP